MEIKKSVHNEVQIYVIDKHGNVVVNPKYLELWDLLTNYVGIYNNMGGLDTTTFFLPSMSQSILRSVSSLTSPESKVRLLIFSQVLQYIPAPGESTFRGPITNEGFALNIFGNLLKYKVSWEILNSKPTTIGFYTSEGFQFDVVNYLYLMSGSRGPSIFKENIGSFIFSGDMNMYVVVDRDVDVKITVDVIIPKSFYSPDLVPGQIYTKYLQVAHCEKLYKVPVYNSQLSDIELYTIITTPSCYFRKLYDLMLEYLDKTSLNLTLFSNNITNPTLLGIDLFPSITYKNVPNTTTGFGGTNTIRTEKLNLSGGSTWGSGVFAWEVSFRLKPNLLQNKKFPLITLNVSVGLGQSVGLLDKIKLTVQKYSGVWKNQTNVNKLTGKPDGFCTIEKDIEFDDGVDIKTSFLLDQEATDFNVTLYKRDYRNIVYKSITVDYVTVPYID